MTLLAYSTNNFTKPVLKWAGGKTQLLDTLIPNIPHKYGKYIEPFIGGGALFFSIQPPNAVIADSNYELINLYRTIACNVECVINNLKTYRNTEEIYYRIRNQDIKYLTNVQMAARTIYLNKTCFNGLYRVNKKGQFNVPYGYYSNPCICDEDNLRKVSLLLQNTEIIHGDYKEVLKKTAQPGDFVFLDPPYLPVSAYSDFKRYTKEQFYEEDHCELAKEIIRLHELGCFVIHTNSNHPLVHELYNGFKIDIYKTKRYINSKAARRYGEDVVVTIPPRINIKLQLVPQPLSKQILKYPSTRFMGSKRKIITQIRDVINHFDFETVYDVFSGSGIVGYMLKAEGKQVTCNDYMSMNALISKALIENNITTLPLEKAVTLLKDNSNNDNFVQNTFHGLYFTDEENTLIDIIRANIKNIRNPYQYAIAKSALIRACFKKRPRGIFTYTGQRYDDGRKDLKLSLEEHFLNAVNTINAAVFDNGKSNKSRKGDALTINSSPDLVYIDPPYYSPHSDNEYVRRYHFLEGIACDWENVKIQWNTKTKKFKSYPTPFSSRIGTHDAFNHLFRRFRNSIIVVSYSSNSLPTLEEMVSLISQHKKHVEVLQINHRYSFGNQAHKVNNNNNKVHEYIFVGY